MENEEETERRAARGVGEGRRAELKDDGLRVLYEYHTVATVTGERVWLIVF